MMMMTGGGIVCWGGDDIDENTKKYGEKEKNGVSG